MNISISLISASRQTSSSCSNPLEERAVAVNNYCSQERSMDPIRQYYYFEVKVPKFFNILVDGRHKLLYCAIPKAGCTSWKNYLVLMSDLGKRSKGALKLQVHNRPILRRYGLKFLSEYSPTEIKKRIESKKYSKFIVARHPFARLYSAYMDKYYDHVYSSGITRRIIKKYRPQGAANSLSPKSHKIYPTFEEFSRFVASEYPKHFREAHWTKYQDLCYPCQIHYDHVLKLETMDTDAKNFLSLPFMSDGNDIELPKYNPSSGSKAADKLNMAFKTLPREVIDNLYKLYEEDFKMFGYSWDFENLQNPCNINTKGKCC